MNEGNDFSEVEIPKSVQEIQNVYAQANIPGGGNVGPPRPDTQPPGPERGETPEALRMGYTRELYTVEGADFITEIKEALDSADINQIRRVAESSMGFMEGLYYGIEGENYDIDNDDLLASELMDQFTDVESSTDRPSYGQVFLALRHGLTEAVRDADRFNKYKRQGDVGLDKWRVQLSSVRKIYWSAVSESRVQQGMMALSDKEIEEHATDDVGRQEKRLDEWLQNKSELIGLKHHLDARILTFDPGFMQRQKACENEKNQVELTDKGIKPDKGSWTAYYLGNHTKEKWEKEGISEWGDAVSRVEDIIEQIGTGEIEIPGLQDNPNEDYYVKDIYVNGFRNVGEFKAWMKVLLEHSKINGETRMDVVWNAWKMSLWKENISRLAWRVDKNGVYQFGTPPFASDLMTKLIHNDKVRAKELGIKGTDSQGNIIDLDEWEVLDRRGKKIRDLTEDEFERFMRNTQRSKAYRAISHSGHAMSIGRVRKLQDEYESRTEIEKWEDPRTGDVLKKISLRAIAQRGISRGSRDFPWGDTQLRHPGDPVGEAPSGSAGGWFLSRLRGSTVRNEHLRTIPGPRDLTIEFFESPVVRMWDKLHKLSPGPLRNGVPQNPYAWYLAGIIRSRTAYGLESDRGNTQTEFSAYVQGERGFRSRDNQNKTELKRIGLEQSGTVTDYSILDNAIKLGCISKEESNWIINNITKRL